MNADTIRRLAAIEMPAEALREVLNIFAEIEAKHEERRTKDAARKREEREIIKASKDNPRTVQGQSTGSPVEVPHAGTRAPEKVLTSLDTKINPLNPPSGDTPTPSEKTRSSRKAKTAIPEDAQPTDKDRAHAVKAGMWPATIDHQWRMFVARHLREGSEFKSWPQAWISWVGKWIEFGRKQIGTTPTLANTSSLDQRVFIEKDTPEWVKWVEYRRLIKALLPAPYEQAGTRKVGAYFPSVVPPISSEPPDATIPNDPPLPDPFEARPSPRAAPEREGEGRQTTGARFAHAG